MFFNALLKSQALKNDKTEEVVLVSQWWGTCLSPLGRGFHSGPCSYLIDVTWVTCEKNVVQFDSSKHSNSPRILRLPPVVTVDA